MKIAILDAKNQDIGLKILFPEADYYIQQIEYESKKQNMDFYHMNYKMDWSSINDHNYDYLFIISALYNTYLPNEYENNLYRQEIKDYLNIIEAIIEKNNFSKVCFFDNFDYDYDPNMVINNPKINFFFKRNYCKDKIYQNNVIPFPFIMFGYHSLIEKMDKELVSEEEYFKEKHDVIFYTGGLYIHDDPFMGVYRDRITIFNEIKEYLFNPGYIPYSNFINTLRNCKFSLDLLGVGEPNMRTIEILLSGSLMISQKNNLYWPFPESFSKELQFDNKDDFFKIIKNLRQNPELFNKCLKEQYDIVKKYFNKEWIRNYILSKIV